MLVAKNGVIAAKDEALAAAKQIIAFLENSIVSKDKELAAEKQVIASLKDTIVSRNEAIASKDKELAVAQKVIMSKEHEIASLNTKLLVAQGHTHPRVSSFVALFFSIQFQDLFPQLSLSHRLPLINVR